MDRRLVAKKIVQSMARGLIVLDENLENLKENLEERNIRIITIPKGTKDSEIKKNYLSRRLFLTNNPKDFIDDASSFEYGIISTQSIKYKGENSLAALISRALSKHQLGSKQHGFIIELNDKGDGTVKNLID